MYMASIELDVQALIPNLVEEIPAVVIIRIDV
jgi:hypothetical protein